VADKILNIETDALTDQTLLRERKKRIFNLKSVIFFLLSLIIVGFLLRKLELAKTLEILLQSDISLMGIAVLLYFSVNFFKSVRYRILFKGTSLGVLFTVSSYHNFFNMILPARTGELTFIYYAKKLSGIEITKSLHVLLVVRVFDFIVISMIFITSILIYYGTGVSPVLLAMGVGFFVISVIILLNLKYMIKFFHYCFSWFIFKAAISEKSIIKNINNKLLLLVDEFYGFKTREFVPLLTLTTLIIWFLLYIMFFIIIQSFGVSMDLLRSVIGSTGGVLTNVLPINSFGSFGTLEAGWTGGFILVGMSEQEAIITGFGSHIIELFASTLQAAFCIVASRLFKKRKL